MSGNGFEDAVFLSENVTYLDIPELKRSWVRSVSPNQFEANLFAGFKEFVKIIFPSDSDRYNNI